MINIVSLTLFTFLFAFSTFAAPAEAYSDSEQEEVKSIWCEKEGWRLAYPVINLNAEDKIAIHFDIINGNDGSLTYKIIHCDRDWYASDLFTSDYIAGFEENMISDYEASFNTTVKYTHYTLTLPNEDVKFKISGNYALIVYRSGEEDKPLLTRRFFVSEGSTSAVITPRRPMGSMNALTHQQFEITISTGSLNVQDPYNDITISVFQNGRWDKAKTNLKPDFVGNETVEFNTLSDKTLFPGGNEFRYFDIKTIRQKRQNVRDIIFLNGFYHVYLLPSEDREFKPYFFSEDFNGKFYIAMEESDTPDRDADYVWVYFTLPVKYEAEGGSVYISGSFTDWKTGPGNRMTYNASKSWYEATMLLKQGWYNYEYFFVPDGKINADRFYFEGSHYETLNDYLILTYYRDPRQRYDRLTDAETVSSSGKK